MTTIEAFKVLIETEDWFEIAKQKNHMGSRCRVSLSRFRKGALDDLAIMRLLYEFGYEIDLKIIKKEGHYSRYL